LKDTSGNEESEALARGELGISYVFALIYRFRHTVLLAWKQANGIGSDREISFLSLASVIE